MYKLLIYSIIFFLSINSLAQTSIKLPDTNLTVYDVYYLESLVDTQTNIVSNLNVELTNLQIEYNKLNNELSKIQFSLNLYESIYSNLLLSIYKIKSTLFSTFIFLFSSNSFNQLYKRFNYFKLLSKYLKNLTQYINLLNKQLNLSLKSLDNSKLLLNTCLNNYQNKKILLDSNTNLLLRQSSILQQNVSSLRIELNKDYNRYDSIISHILTANIDYNPDSSGGFDITISPILNPVVISSFGVHSHPYIDGITIKNDGIDLYSETDTTVRVVQDGKIVAIIAVPKYGKSIVVKHHNYYTVYSNLNLIYVTNNSIVFKSQLLGTLSKNTSKYSFPCLNFQVWKEQEKINPKKFYDF